MDRRSFLITTGVAAVVAALPAPLQAAMADRRIRWEGNSINSPHATIVAKWLNERIKDGILYCRDEFVGCTIKLTDPYFIVVEGAPIWNWMTGYTTETGLAIAIHEKGVLLDTVGLATSIGYEDYWSDGKERDMERFPDYFVRSAWVNYDDRKKIEPHLPKDHFGIDMRWIEAYKQQRA